MKTELTWFSVDNEEPKPDTLCMISDDDGNVQVGYFHNGKWFNSEKHLIDSFIYAFAYIPTLLSDKALDVLDEESLDIGEKPVPEVVFINKDTPILPYYDQGKELHRIADALEKAASNTSTKEKNKFGGVIHWSREVQKEK